MTGYLIDKKCPLCGASLLRTERGHIYCSLAGCEFGLWEGFNVRLDDEEIVEIGGKI